MCCSGDEDNQKEQRIHIWRCVLYIVALYSRCTVQGKTGNNEQALAKRLHCLFLLKSSTLLFFSPPRRCTQIDRNLSNLFSIFFPLFWFCFHNFSLFRKARTQWPDRKDANEFFLSSFLSLQIYLQNALNNNACNTDGLISLFVLFSMISFCHFLLFLFGSRLPASAANLLVPLFCKPNLVASRVNIFFPSSRINYRPPFDEMMNRLVGIFQATICTSQCLLNRKIEREGEQRIWTVRLTLVGLQN